MTTDRKKAALYLSATLIVGILLGALIPGTFGKFRERGHPPHDRKGGLAHVIGRIVNPNTDQADKIKPLAEKASARIDVLQDGCNQEIKTVMDSLRVQLKPILTPEQISQLDKFLSKGGERWKGR